MSRKDELENLRWNKIAQEIERVANQALRTSIARQRQAMRKSGGHLKLVEPSREPTH